MVQLRRGLSGVVAKPPAAAPIVLDRDAHTRMIAQRTHISQVEDANGALIAHTGKRSCIRRAGPSDKEVDDLPLRLIVHCPETKLGRV
ncbi:MAG: hypothetical protein B7Y90_09250 [Alphaproteobacteria bacterium 32-64-14]|nr:MAG: hypothetical protein B7Y90_09250 [Alphaproteobacteria bacterium 32-64-14]